MLRAHFRCQQAEVGNSLIILPLLVICFRSVVTRLLKGCGIRSPLLEHLARDADGAVVIAKEIRATEYAQSGNIAVFLRGSSRLEPLKIGQRLLIIGNIVIQLSRTHQRLLHIRVSLYLRKALKLNKRILLIPHLIIGVSTIVLRTRAITTTLAITLEIRTEPLCCLCVIALHVLQLCSGIRERILFGRNGLHIVFPERFGISQILIHSVGLHIAHLYALERRVRLIGRGIVFHNELVCLDGIFVSLLVVIKHGFFERCLARKIGVGVRSEQSIISNDSTLVIVSLQFRTRNLI